MAWALLLVTSLTTVSPAEEVVVFAAASLSDALKEIASGYESRSPNKIIFSLGASSDLARQIEAGAPADVFFSADTAQMDRLEAAGLVRAADRIDVLSNALVAVVPKASSRRISSAQDLLSVKNLALADPDAVPAGIYARKWLESIHLWDRLKDKVVPALDVRAALAAVESENADAGIVYRTDASISKGVQVAFVVPSAQTPRIVYPLAPIVREKKQATAEIVSYLISPAAIGVYAKYGFIVLRGKSQP